MKSPHSVCELLGHREGEHKTRAYERSYWKRRDFPSLDRKSYCFGTIGQKDIAISGCLAATGIFLCAQPVWPEASGAPKECNPPGMTFFEILARSLTRPHAPQNIFRAGKESTQCLRDGYQSQWMAA